jgi:hypothetical protein
MEESQMKRQRGKMLLALPLVLMAIAGISGVGIAVSSQTATATTATTTSTVSIPATQTWTDTGVAVTEGQTVSITMSGKIHYAPGSSDSPLGKSFTNGACGLNQYLNPPGATYSFPAYGVNCWGSIFKVGSTGIPFPTGKTIQFTSPVSGELFIGVNDNYLLDDHGSFTASITA